MLLLYSLRCFGRMWERGDGDMEKERDYRMDNIRFILIFLTVFGHMITLMPDVSLLYRTIYSFHMPAFLFVTGYFARFDRKRILTKFVYPYFVFQLLYLGFNSWVLDPGSELRIQFVYPFWHLWFLQVITCFYLLIPLFDTDKTWKQLIFFGISVGMALIVPYDVNMDAYLSLMRDFTFLPYFLAGYYLGHNKGMQRFWNRNVFHGAFIKCIVCVLAAYFVLVIAKDQAITGDILFGSASYPRGNYGPEIKWKTLIIAMGWICILLVMIPGRRIPLLSNLGKNTFSVYLLHACLVLPLRTMEIYPFSTGVNLLIAAGLSIGIIVLLGNSFVSRWFSILVDGGWIANWINRGAKRINQYLDSREKIHQ